LYPKKSTLKKADKKEENLEFSPSSILRKRWREFRIMKWCVKQKSSATLNMIGAADQRQKTGRAHPRVVTCSAVPQKDPT
jgi:hypothetical protein